MLDEAKLNPVRSSLAVAVVQFAFITAAPEAQGGIVNGSFETGDFEGWTVTDLSNPFYALNVVTTGEANSAGWPWSSSPTDGDFVAYHGWATSPNGSPGTISIAQDGVLIDAPVLMFDHREAWDLTAGAQLPQIFAIHIRTQVLETKVLSIIADPGTIELDNAVLRESIDVSDFLGQTVEISFDWIVPESFGGPAAAQLDNVRLVPTPGAIGMLGLGMGILGYRKRTRARRSKEVGTCDVQRISN